jgi:hypothetical protein
MRGRGHADARVEGKSSQQCEREQAPARLPTNVRCKQTTNLHWTGPARHSSALPARRKGNPTGARICRRVAPRSIRRLPPCAASRRRLCSLQYTPARGTDVLMRRTSKTITAASQAARDMPVCLVLFGYTARLYREDCNMIAPSLRSCLVSNAETVQLCHSIPLTCARTLQYLYMRLVDALHIVECAAGFSRFLLVCLQPAIQLRLFRSDLHE